MKKKVAYEVTIECVATGAIQNRIIIAPDEATARERAVAKTRNQATTMVERKYGEFRALTCTPKTAVKTHHATDL